MNAKELADVFAALGSELRLRIIELVAGHKEMCICELVDALDMSQANVSRHVRVLRSAGILQSRKMGVLVIHRVDPERIAHASSALGERIAELHHRSEGEDVEARLASRCQVEAS
jgi:ArsR family transcriptional regulator